MEKLMSGGCILEAIIPGKENIYEEEEEEEEEEENQSSQTSLFDDPIGTMVELLIAKQEISRLEESRQLAEKEKAQVEFDLQIARNEAEAITIKIEEVKARTEDRNLDLQILTDYEETIQNNDSLVSETIYQQWCYDVHKETEGIKQELRSCKLEMACVSESNNKAEKEIETAREKASLYLRYADELRKEIEKANFEEVFTDLARVKSEKEYQKIEAQREEEAAHFNKNIEKTSSKIKRLCEQVSDVKELEEKLSETNKELSDLQNEMEFIRAMKKKVDNSESNSMLLSTITELDAARNELLCLKKEGFRLMTEMDQTRRPLVQITEKRELVAKSEVKTNSTLQCLNLKLHEDMSMLESATAAEKRSESIIANLSMALQQVQTDIDAVKRQAELAKEETKAARRKIVKTNSDAKLSEIRLQEVMTELEEHKKSEAVALEQLKKLTEKTMRERANSMLCNTSITISDFEYYYLTKQAKKTQKVADKKVAAAEAWIEAIQATEKEILLKANTTTVVEGKELQMKDKVVHFLKGIKAKSSLNNEKKEDKSSMLKLATAMPRMQLTFGGISGESRRARIRRPSISPGRPSFSRTQATYCYRSKAVKNAAKFLRRKVAKKK